MAAERARIEREVDAAGQVAAQEAAEFVAAEDAQRRGPAPYGVVTRRDYAPREEEGRHLVRDAAGLPVLRLVDAGDRLAIWSPIDGGALLNPKGPGIWRLGLVASYARGSELYADAFCAADLRKGQPVELRREPGNRHDPNAVALYAPRASSPFADVQRGRAAAAARRLDAGECMAAVSMRRPGHGSDDESAFLLIGSEADLAALLRSDAGEP